MFTLMGSINARKNIYRKILFFFSTHRSWWELKWQICKSKAFYSKWYIVIWEKPDINPPHNPTITTVLSAPSAFSSIMVRIFTVSTSLLHKVPLRCYSFYTHLHPKIWTHCPFPPALRNISVICAEMLTQDWRAVTMEIHCVSLKDTLACCHSSISTCGTKGCIRITPRRQPFTKGEALNENFAAVMFQWNLKMWTLLEDL